jgi:MFS family permease
MFVEMRSFTKILRDRGTTLCVAWTFNQLAYAIVYPFIPIYLSKERGIPYSTVGLIFPLMGTMVVLSPMLYGPLTDKIGRRPMMGFGQFARTALFVILAYMTYVHAPFWLFAVVLMFNTGVGVAFQIGADAYLADITSEAERPGYYSKIRIGFNLGWALGPMIGAFFAKTPFWVFFLVTATLCGAGGVFTQLFCRYPEGFTPPARRSGKAGRSGSVIPIIWNQKRILFLLLGAVMLFSLTSQLYSTLSVYSTTTVGISRKTLGFIYSLNGFLVIFLQLPVTLTLKKLRIPLKYQMYAGTLLYIAGYFSLGFCVNAGMVAGSVAVLTFGEMIMLPSLYTAFSNETVPENAGRILAAVALFRGVGYAVGPWFGAQFFQHLKSPVMLWGSLTMFAVVALGFFVLAWSKTVRRGGTAMKS